MKSLKNVLETFSFCFTRHNTEYVLRYHIRLALIKQGSKVEHKAMYWLGSVIGVRWPWPGRQVLVKLRQQVLCMGFME